MECSPVPVYGMRFAAGIFQPVRSINTGLSIERTIFLVCVADIPSIAQEETEDFQGLGIWLRLSLQADTSELPGGPRRKGKPSFKHKGGGFFPLGGGKCHTCHVRCAGFHSHIQGCFIFSPSPATLPSFVPLSFVAVCPWQVLKVMVTAGRVALPDYSREKEY